MRRQTHTQTVKKELPEDKTVLQRHMESAALFKLLSPKQEQQTKHWREK